MKQIFISLIVFTNVLVFFQPIFATEIIEGGGGNTESVSKSILAGSVDPMKGKFDSISSIINSLLPYLLSIAGLVLFGMLIMGGFTMLTAATDPKKAEAGKQRITHAVIGFIIIFTAYWLTQILEIVLGVNIL